MMRILFYTKDAFKVFSLTQLTLQQAGPIWMEAVASSDDINSLRASGVWHEQL